MSASATTTKDATKDDATTVDATRTDGAAGLSLIHI